MSVLREKEKTQQDCSPIEPIGKYCEVIILESGGNVKMNEFKFKAIGNHRNWLTNGKIYTSKDGVITYDDGFEGCEYKSFQLLYSHPSKPSS